VVCVAVRATLSAMLRINVRMKIVA
jgi:hypothetical protein